MLRGINFYPDNPLKFDFVVDQDQDTRGPVHGDFENESKRLIQYFLASLTMPENEMWVNLSPYEKDRIIPEALGKTSLGQDLLDLDFALKQLASSLSNPDQPLGKAFWQRLYLRVTERFGTTEVPVDTLHKIWIVPGKATFYEHARGVVIVDSHLKVMLEDDYKALAANTATMKGVSGDITREILIPEIENEVNTGLAFARLRQIYHAMLLASWYKRTLKANFLTQAFADQRKTTGVRAADKTAVQDIYNRYIASFRQGVFNVIREQVDPQSGMVIPRKYFSGGVVLNSDHAMLSPRDTGALVAAVARWGKQRFRLTFGLAPVGARLDLDAQFDRYMARDRQLKGYVNRPLRHVFSPEVMRALLRDPSLRVVFLRHLSESSGQVGPLEAVDLEAVKKIGGREVLDASTGFLVGDAQRANAELEKGAPILAGVTDRSTDKTLIDGYNVANRRQVFFPLANGQWLGIKGAGDLLNEEAPFTFYTDRYFPQIWGLALLEEARRAERSIGLLKGTAFSGVQLLGYRLLNVLSDGQGETRAIKGVDLMESAQPGDKMAVLIMNLVDTPHRIVKLPQLLETDPGLKRLHADISDVKRMKGLAAPETPGIMIRQMVKQIALNTAFKHNHGLYKISLHLQDILVSGEEADHEEWISCDEMLKRVTEDPYARYQPYALHFLKQYKISLGDLNSCFVMIESLTKELLTNQNAAGLISTPVELLKDFLSEYFSSLSDDNLRAWMKEVDVIHWGNNSRNFSRPLEATSFYQSIDTFHPHPSGNRDRDKFEVLLMMQTILENEFSRREMVLPPGHVSVVSSPSVLKAELYRRPGCLSPNERDAGYGDYRYPAVERRVVLKALKELSIYPGTQKMLGNAAARDEIIAYAMGERSYENAFEHIINIVSGKSPDVSRYIKRNVSAALYSVRIGGKYKDPSGFLTTQVIFEFLSSRGPVVDTRSSARTKKIFSMFRDEINQLVSHRREEQDQRILADVMEQLGTVDLGDTATLKEVDASMNERVVDNKNGGIDLNPGLVDSNVIRPVCQNSRNGWSPALLDHLTGFVPVIIRKTPMGGDVF